MGRVSVGCGSEGGRDGGKVVRGLRKASEEVMKGK